MTPRVSQHDIKAHSRREITLLFALRSPFPQPLLSIFHSNTTTRSVCRESHQCSQQHSQVQVCPGGTDASSLLAVFFKKKQAGD